MSSMKALARDILEAVSLGVVCGVLILAFTGDYAAAQSTGLLAAMILYCTEERGT